jgi:hypothetical protein
MNNVCVCAEVCNPFIGMHAAVFRPVAPAAGAAAASAASAPASSSASAAASASPHKGKRKAGSAVPDSDSASHSDKKQHTTASASSAGGSGGVVSWRASECLSVGEALHLYTAGAAYCAGAEQRLGKLEPGFAADWYVALHFVLHCAPLCCAVS